MKTDEHISENWDEVAGGYTLHFSILYTAENGKVELTRPMLTDIGDVPRKEIPPLYIGVIEGLLEEGYVFTSDAKFHIQTEHYKGFEDEESEH